MNRVSFTIDSQAVHGKYLRQPELIPEPSDLDKGSATRVGATLVGQS